jgi:hypothetical protein
MGAGGQLKTDDRVKVAGVQHREIPLPSSPNHPRAQWFAGIRRGLRFRSFRVQRGTSEKGRLLHKTFAVCCLFLCCNYQASVFCQLSLVARLWPLRAMQLALQNAR